MASLLYRLGRTAFRRWPLFLASWIVVVVAVGGVAGAFGKPMVDAFSIPGIPSEKASDLQAELFPDAARPDAPSGTVVVSVPSDDADGKLTDEKYTALVDELVEDLKAAPQMGDNAEAVVSPVRQLQGAVAQSIEAGADEETATAQAKVGLEQGAILSEDERTGKIGFVFDEENAKRRGRHHVPWLEEGITTVIFVPVPRPPDCAKILPRRLETRARAT